MALKYITLDDVPSVVPVQKTYTPKVENRPVYDAMIKEFEVFYGRNKGMFRRLNART